MHSHYLFGSSAILGPSGSRPWLLGGSEDPWLSVPVFRRVWLYRLLCFLYTPSRWTSPIVNIIWFSQADGNVAFGSLAASQDSIIPTAAIGGKADVLRFNFGSPGLNVRFRQKRSFRPN